MCLITLSRNTFHVQDSEGVQNGTSQEVVLTCISKRSVELISVQEQWLNKKRNACGTSSIKPELCTRRNVTQVLSSKNMLRYDL